MRQVQVQALGTLIDNIYPTLRGNVFFTFAWKRECVHYVCMEKAYFANILFQIKITFLKHGHIASPSHSARLPVHMRHSCIIYNAQFKLLKQLNGEWMAGLYVSWG